MHHRRVRENGLATGPLEHEQSHDKDDQDQESAEATQVSIHTFLTLVLRSQEDFLPVAAKDILMSDETNEFFPFAIGNNRHGIDIG